MLLDILKELAAIGGEELDNTAQRDLLVARINHAAREIHDSTDLEESLQETILDVNVSSQRIALPPFIYQVVGLRNYLDASVKRLDNIKNYFNDSPSNEPWDLQWRQVKSAPNQRELSNESVLKATIPLKNEESFDVIISGTTQHAYRESETLNFGPDDTEKTTLKNFREPLDSIKKSRKTKYNITIWDVENNSIAVIPNTDKKAFYKVIQIDNNSLSIPTTFSAVEVLYKVHFTPGSDDTDVFWFTDKYDRAIIYKYRELFGSDSVETALAFNAKAKQELDSMLRTEKRGVREKINFAINPFFRMPYARSGRSVCDQ